ncbi:MAG: tetratricopeptide repeat protein [Candidatus Odinarchaeota archaeon]
MPKDEFYTKGVYLFNKRKYKAAIKNFDKILQEKPDFERALLYKGKSHYMLKNYEEAKLNIDKVLEINPNSVNALLSKIKVLIVIGPYEEALESCNKLLELRPNKYWLQLAYIHERFKNFEKALDCVEKALLYKPNSDKVLRAKLVLQNALKYGDNYYIPVVRSRLLKLIPPDEEVIYSTNIRLSWKIKQHDGKSISAMVTLWWGAIPGLIHSFLHTDKDKGTFFTDVLATPRGWVLLKPTIIMDEGHRTKEPFKFEYIPWKKINFISESEMIVDNYFNCELDHLPYFESEHDFENRKYSFYTEIKKLRHQYTKKCIENAKDYLKNNEYEKASQYVDLGWGCNIPLAEFDLSDDLRDMESKLYKQKEEKRSKMFEEMESNLINYLQQNNKQAFTSQTLMNRLNDYIIEPELQELFMENVEGLLNKLTFNGKIKQTTHEGEKFYFI